MKNYLAIPTVFLFLGKMVAQITLTSANMPQPNSTIFSASTTANWNAGISVGAPGANQTWDFSGAELASGPTPYSYFAPDAAPGADQYPTATIFGAENLTDTAFFDFYLSNDDQFSLLGTRSSVDGFIDYSEPFVQFELPFDNQSVIFQSIETSGTLSNLPISGTLNQVVQADAWGKVTTILGTFPCLRVKRFVSQTFALTPSISLSDNSVRYEWWTTGHHAPVFSLDSTETTVQGNTELSISGTILTDEALTAWEPETKNRQAEISIFPNPATDHFEVKTNLEKPESLDLLIFDTNGKLMVSKNKIEATSGKFSQELNVSELIPGDYLVVLKSRTGLVGIKSWVKS